MCDFVSDCENLSSEVPSQTPARCLMQHHVKHTLITWRARSTRAAMMSSLNILSTDEYVESDGHFHSTWSVGNERHFATSQSQEWHFTSQSTTFTGWNRLRHVDASAVRACGQNLAVELPRYEARRVARALDDGAMTRFHVDARKGLVWYHLCEKNEEFAFKSIDFAKRQAAKDSKLRCHNNTGEVRYHYLHCIDERPYHNGG